MSFLTIILLIIFVILILKYLFNMHKNYSYFKNRSLKTPRFNYFFGHYLSIWSSSSISRQYEKWTSKYGRIYGLYEGQRPVYVVSDVDFLEKVFVSEFSKFHSRRMPFLVRLSNGNYVHLFGAEGNRWRRQRHIINPTFSNKKLKLMMNLMNHFIEELLQKIENENEKQINIIDFYKKLTFDIICRCAFGIDTNIDQQSNQQIRFKLTQFFEDNHEKIFIVKLSYLIPSLIPFLTYFIAFQMKLFSFLRSSFPSYFNQLEEFPGFSIINQVKNVVHQRIQHSENYPIDLLQLMINKSTSNQNDIDDSKLDFEHIHYDEIASNVFLFMLAGHDSISITLTNATYILATNETIQTKLRQEIDSFFQTNQTFDYENIDQIQYLDLFLKEVLRFYPVAIQAISRECSQDTIINNYQINQGDVIQVDVYSIHFDREVWGPDDPYEFVPERHIERRHPISFLSFGQGPRNCIGLRFAYMELKLTLTYLLKTYFIQINNHIEYSTRETLIIGPKQLFVQFIKRN